MPRYELKRPKGPDRKGVNPFTKAAITILGRPAANRFWEIERRGSTLETCEGEIGDPGRRKTKKLPSAIVAMRRMARAIGARVGGGYVEAGPSIALASEGGPPAVPASALLIDEYFAAGDERFVDEVLRFSGVEKLGSLADKLLVDTRPFARGAILSLIDDGCDRHGHKALVKRLFKGLEKAGDDEAMAHFLVAFDRLSRRALVVVSNRWDPAMRKAIPVEGLVNELPVPARLREKGKSERFTRVTRRYLARRAFRYFRLIGRSDPARFRRAMLVALPLYRDEHLDAPERLLDAWGLAHVLYGRSPVLARPPSGLRPAPGMSLAALAPAPYFKEPWLGCEEDLFALLGRAESRAVRTWTIAWLRASYPASLRGAPAARALALLTSPHEEVQLLGSEMLGTASGIEALPIDAWLRALGATSLDAVSVVCAAVKKHVTPARLTLPQCVALGCAKVAPVAELGLEWARTKAIATDGELAAILKLADAGVASVRSDAVAWCASLLRTMGTAKPERVRDLCDARFPDARAAGLTLLSEIPRFHDELSLWLALTESPYPDVRAFVVARAKEWRDRASGATLVHVWASALVAIHGGSDVKREVPRAIADRVAAHPDEADALLPLLGLALRSVRPSERAFGLAAVARAAVAHPALRAAAARHLPELSLGEMVSA